LDVSKQSKRLKEKIKKAPTEYVLVVGDGITTEVVSFETSLNRSKFIDTILELDDGTYFTFIVHNENETQHMH